MSSTKKFPIKPLHELHVTHEFHHLVDHNKAKSIEDGLQLVAKQGFIQALVPTADGRMTIAVAFPHNEKLMLGVAPRPVDLYFGIAYNFMRLADQYLLEMDEIPSALGPKVVRCSDDTFHAFLQYRISFVMLLHASVETFINAIVPDGEYRYPLKRKSTGKGHVELLAKEEIEQLGFSKKLKDVVPHATGIDVAQTNSKLFKRIRDLNDVRCDVTHLRSIDNGKGANYITVYVKLAQIDMRDAFDAVREYVNLIRPDTIQFTGE